MRVLLADDSVFALLKQLSLKWFLVSFMLFISGYGLRAQTGIEPNLVGGVYQIATLENLTWIVEQVNSGNDFSGINFQQTANINASATSEASWNSGAGWTAIGNADNSYAFSGSYDGQGYTIANLYINNPSANYYGLFGYCANATIQNLGVTNVSIIAGGDVGGLAGYMDAGGTISNCYVTGEVTSKGSSGVVGGLCGESFSNVDNCFANCTVVADYGAAAGLIANFVAANLTNSYSSGSVTVNNEASEVGGLVGTASVTSSIEYCYSESSVSTNGVLHRELSNNPDFSNIGGLIGTNQGTVANCYATGSLTILDAEKESEIGGLLGENTGNVSYCYAANSLSVTPLAGNTPTVGGFVGVNYDENYYWVVNNSNAFQFTAGTVNNTCYWNSSIYANGCGSNSFTYLTPYTGTFSGTGKTTTEMQTTSTYSGWSFSTTWNRMDTRNNKYPVLIFLPRLTTNITTFGSSSATMGGNITNDGNGATPGRGIVYSLSTNMNPIIGGTGVTQVSNAAITNNFSASITGLSPNTMYYVQAYTTNTRGTSYGGARSFTTLAAVPTATTNAATSVTSTGATLNGSINANNASTTVTFEYGPTIGYGTSVSATPATVTGSSATAVSKAITGLTAGTTYHYRVVGVNTGGTTNGTDLTFTTLPKPMILTFNTDLGVGNPNTITLPLRGTVNVTVDWGDGSTNTYASTSYGRDHTYSTAGIYTVTITGSCTEFGFGGDATTSTDKLISVADFGELGLTSLAGAFKNALNLTAMPATLPPTVTNLSYLFYGSSNFNVDLSSWNTQNVTDMSYMFGEATIFNQEIGGWNVSQVTNMEGMFRFTNFNKDLSNWNVGNVTDMNYMFIYCSKFDQNIGGWDISKVTYMASMFQGVTLSTLNYNALLTGWAAKTVQQNVSFHAGSSKYNVGAPATAKAKLTDSFNWTITDGGMIIDPPAIASISPINGPTAGGTSVVITGTNLTAATAVKFGSTNATSITINSATQITAISPAGSAGAVDITVTTTGGTSATSASDQFTYVAAPTVTSISPINGPTAGGTSVIVTGTNLTAATAVNFGGTTGSMTANTATSITVTSPAGSAGTVDITVITAGGTSATSSSDQFTYVAAPTVTGISPTNGPTAGGTTVTITGTNFLAASSVKFGSTNATGYTINSATQITATSPAGSAGAVDITVTTAGGTSATSGADQFTYIAAPTITGISPTSGPTAGSTSVVITGTNLTAATAVNFGGTTGSMTANTATSITVTSPAGSAGTVDITVTTAGGTSATSSSDQFTYVAAPTVTGISTTSGPTAGSTSVVITGTNFLAASAVKFGSTNAIGFTINSSTQITASSPAGSAGAVDITVTTAGGTSATSSADQFTYVAAPTVISNAATSVTSTGATLNGTINANNASTTVTFEYGLNTSYGTTVTADQSPVTGGTATSVSKAITGLTAGVTYYYRVVAVNAGGTTNGSGQSFTTSLLTGNGTPADPYQIATLADLKWVSEHSNIWNSSFIQTANIDASITSTWNISKGFLPIGNTTTKFTGNYNGQNHTITGLTINRSDEYNVGLFGVTTNAILKNIALLDCSVIGGYNVGGLVGYMGYNSTLTSSISDCYCTGNVSGTGYVSGLVGVNKSSSITNSYSTCNVTATSNAAGLVSLNINSTITNCFYDSNTSGQSDTGKGTPKTTAEMKIQSTFTCWDFAGETANGTTDIWAISSTQNNGYPCFMSQITSPIAPTVTTQAITGIATTTATGNGNMTGLGVPNPGSHGVCWGTNANPTIIDNTVANIGGVSVTGDFVAPITGLTPNTLYHVRAYATNSTGTVYGTDASFTTKIPTITSATYNASTGVLVLTCTYINTGNIISPAKMTLTGEGGTPYSLTTANVAASGSTSASITLNATDKAAINQIFNKNGTSSTGATTYNLAAADDWDTSISAGDISDLTGNGITVSNVAVPTITSATYDAATGALVFAGTGFLKFSGAVNDINVSKLTITGEAGVTYTLTTANVEISSGTSFTVPLNATDKAAVNQIINKNGASSIGGTTYNLAAAEDWDAGADVAVVIADLTGNGIVVSNLASPTVTTQAVSAITAISATGNGNITSMGVPDPTQYGVVWSTSPNPTVALTTKTTQGTAAATGIFASSITGLTPNTTYYVKAYATNIVGTLYGAEVSFISSDIVPDAPTAVLATGENGQAIVSFTAPASNGGTSITGYTVTSNPGGLTATGSSSPITVTGLTNGSAYTFTVTATNGIGTGSASAATNSVTPNAAPITQVSSIVFSSVGLTQMTIGWINGNGTSRAVFVKEGAGTITNPSDNTTYTANTDWASKGDQLGTSGYYCVYNNTSNSVTITGLTVGTTYTVQVFEYNGSAGTEKYYTATASDNPKSQTTLMIAPSALSYSPSSIVATINTTNVSASATVTGTVVSYGITPALPTGVTLNTSTGVISGTPTVLSVQTDYTVTATNTGGSTTATFTLTVNAIAPSALSYSPGTVVATINTTNVSSSPTVTGIVVSYGISPALPTGVSLNTSTGVISGTPTVLSVQTDYTVTATNTGGSTTATFTLTVNAIAPSALSYSPGTVVATINTTNVSSSPTVTGIVVSYGISPALPTGVTLDTSTGAISGTPTVLSVQTDYTVTATNTGGSTTATFRLTVTGIAPTITTQAVTDISTTTATGNGNITDLGVPNPTAYGVCWNTGGTPTTSDSNVDKGSASSTGAYTASMTGLTANTVYHVRSFATNIVGTSYGTDVTFTTLAAATSISGTANWSTGVWTDGTPTTSSDVTVGTGSITVDGNYTVNDLTVSSDGALNIGSGKTLTVNGNLVLTSDGTNTSSLIIDGTLNVTGTTTVQRYMVANKWYIVSPTASGQTVADFLAANTNIPTNSSGKRAMQDYNTTDNSWNPYFTSATPGTMDVGKGLAARISATGHLNFVGALAFGNKDVTVTRTGDNGWNCIGNPYASAININTAGNATNNFLTTNISNLDPSYAAIYIWDEYDVNNGSQNYYKVISNAQFTLPNTALGQNSVQVGQGFLVKVKTSPSVVSFTPAMQVIQNGLALKSANTSWPAVELTVKTDSLSSFTDIAYNEKMTLGLDPSYDAGLLRGSNKLSVYSHLVNDNGLDFAIQCLPENQLENMVIPIGVDYTKGGELKISAQSVELPSGTKVILEDKVLNSFTDLTDGAEYKVSVSADTKGVGRFYLHTTNQIISGLNNAVLAGKLTAYAIGNTEIRIVGQVSSKAIATLYDVQGKVMLIENLNEGTLNVLPTTGIKPGIYMLSVKDNGTLQTFKFVIRP